MKNLKQHVLLAAFAVSFLFTSCSKDEATTTNPTPSTPTYYLNCKIDGVLTEFAKVQVGRATVNSEETFLIKANKTTTGADTATQFIMTLQSPFIGWADGLNLAIDKSEFVGSVNYLTKAGMVYNTQNLTGSQKVNVFLSKVSYKKDGIIKGTFSGTLNNSAKTSVIITEGTFNCLVEN